MAEQQQHPVTPSSELVTRLRYEAPTGELAPRELHLIAAAYRAGADYELGACEQFILSTIRAGAGSRELAEALRAARRPKPKSLKKQALERCNDYIDPDGIIRLALEALPDDN